MRTPLRAFGNAVTRAQALDLSRRSACLRGMVLDGFRVIAATDRETIERAITTAIVTGSVGAVEIVYEVAGPRVLAEERRVERFAKVERAKR